MTYLALLVLAALDAAGYGVIAPVVPEIADRTGAGPTTMGLLVASFALGQLAGYALAGRIVTTHGARVVLAGSLLLVVAGDLGFVLLSGLDVWFPARIVQGVGAAGLWLGVTFAVLERWPGEEYRRLTGVLAAYAVGGIAGPAFGAVDGVAGPFLVHLGVTVAAGAAVVVLRRPQLRPQFRSDRAALRTPGFRVASIGILLVALGLGTLEGPLPLHFGERLDQLGLAALYVGASAAVGVASVAAARLAPSVALYAAVGLVPLGIGVAAALDTVPLWVVGVGIAAIGLGLGEAGALGILLEDVGTERIVLALVVWSQVWGVGYLVGPALAGGLADAVGTGAVVLVPLTASALVVAAAFAARPALVP